MVQVPHRAVDTSVADTLNAMILKHVDAGTTIDETDRAVLHGLLLCKSITKIQTRNINAVLYGGQPVTALGHE